MNLTKLINFQEELARKVRLDSSFNINALRFVVGVDVSYSRKAELCCCCASLYDVKLRRIVERAFLFKSTRDMFPYIPGFFLFREGDIMVNAVKLIKHKVDVVLVDGNGILHPRKAGIACYVGVKLKKPTIGVAKSLLCGELKGDDVVVDGEVRSKVIKLNNRNFYLSPGHEVDLNGAMNIVKVCVQDNLIMPLHDADRKSREAIKEMVMA